MQVWQISTLYHPIVLSSIFADQNGQFDLKYLKTSKTTPVGKVAFPIKRIYMFFSQTSFQNHFDRSSRTPSSPEQPQWRRARMLSWNLLMYRLVGVVLGDWETRSINQFYRCIYTFLHFKTPLQVLWALCRYNWLCFQVQLEDVSRSKSELDEKNVRYNRCLCFCFCC